MHVTWRDKPVIPVPCLTCKNYIKKRKECEVWLTLREPCNARIERLAPKEAKSESVNSV